MGNIVPDIDQSRGRQKPKKKVRLFSMDFKFRRKVSYDPEEKKRQLTTKSFIFGNKTVSI